MGGHVQGDREVLRGARLADPALEREYRLAQAAGEARAAAVVIAIATLAAVAVVLLRSRLGSPGPGPPPGLWLARAAASVLAAVALWREREPARASWLALLWALFFALALVQHDAGRPQAWVLQHVTGVLAVVTFWAVAPNALPLQAAAALAVTAAEVVIQLRLRDPLAPEAWAFLAVAYAAAHALGATASWRLHRARRLEFAGRRLAEQATAEVRTLRGMLRVCAWCRKVVDASGNWTPLERYVAEHTDASVSHGLCPACMAKQVAGGGAGRG